MRENFIEMSDEEIEKKHMSGPLGDMVRDPTFVAAQRELLKRAMVQVSKEVRKFSRSSTILAGAMILLTIAIGWLTYLMYCKQG